MFMKTHLEICQRLDDAWKKVHADQPFEVEGLEAVEEQEREALEKQTDTVAMSIVADAMVRPGNGSYSTCVWDSYRKTPYNSQSQNSKEPSHRYSDTGGGDGVEEEASVIQEEPLVHYHPHPESIEQVYIDCLSRPIEFISSPVEFLIKLRIQEEKQGLHPSDDNDICDDGYGVSITNATLLHEDTCLRLEQTFRLRRTLYPLIGTWTWKQYEWVFLDQIIQNPTHKYAEVLRYAAQGRRFGEFFSQYAFRLGRLFGMFEVETTFPFWQKVEIFLILKATVGLEVFGKMEAAALQQRHGCIESLEEGWCELFCEALAVMGGPDDALAKGSVRGMMRRQEKHESVGGEGQEASVVEDKRPVRYFPYPENRSNPSYLFIASPFEFLTKLRIQYEREVLGRVRSDDNNGNINGSENDDNLPEYDNYADNYQDDSNYAQYIHSAASDHFPTLERFQDTAMISRHVLYPHIKHWTWKQYESIFVDVAISTSQKLVEVLQYAQQGRHKHEPYKVYARRLRRLVEMYKIDSSLPGPSKKNPIYMALERSVSCRALNYIRLYWEMLDGPEDTPECMKMEAARRKDKKRSGGSVEMLEYDEKIVRYHPFPEFILVLDPDYKYITTPIEFLLRLRVHFEQRQLRQANGDTTERDDFSIKLMFSDKDPNDIDTDFDYASYIYSAIHYRPTKERFETTVIYNRRTTYPLVEKWDWKRYEWAFVQGAIPNPYERIDQVSKYVRQGRYKHEPYKEYAQRLRRLVDMYAVREYPLPIQNRIFALLERSVEWETLDQMRFFWRMKQKDPYRGFCEDWSTSSGGWSTKCEHFCDLLGGLIGPDDARESLR
ncbi:MAG: hypothetical protein J3R72DRAFT_444462 [Linnemannia gamsii]|nr:MAG: hypothetical protein J3R72DRAFT_444462 [Linnemannia gamsii]